MQRQWRSDDTEKWTYGFGNGSDGDLTISSNTTEAPIDSSCSGTAGTNSLSATNASFAPGQLIKIVQVRGTGAGAWELAKITGYTAGTITTDKNLANTYTDSGSSQAYVRVYKQYNNVVINGSITYTGKSWDQDVGLDMGWFAKSTTITGTVSVKGNNGTSAYTGPGVGVGFKGGNGSITNGPDPDQAYCGEGTGGASAKQRTANGNGGGGCNVPDVSYSGGGGGGGGNGTAGANGGTRSGHNEFGYGGSTAGTASLVTMVAGGGGGGGGNDGGAVAAAGGAGGGCLSIFSKEITITGSITANGGTGGGNYAGGGGGAGGSVLLKCETATLGTNLITATGGSGGSSAFEGVGGSGGVGRIHIDYSDSYTGTTSPTIDATLDSTIVTGGDTSSMFLIM